MNKFQNIRTGVIGTGSMGKNHVRILSEISNIVAVSDINKEIGQEISKEYKIDYFEDYRDMANLVDAVSIVVPSTMHREVAEFFIEKGKSLLIEKPLSISVSDSESIVEMSRINGVTLAVGHIERHNPVIGYAKKRLVEGVWGDLISMSARRFSRFPERINDVGVLFDLMIHDVDLMRYISDREVSSIFASGFSKNKINFEDNVISVINFEDQIQGLCETNWLTPMKVREVCLTTTKYHIKLDLLHQFIEMFSSKTTGQPFHVPGQKGLDVNYNKIKPDDKEPLKEELVDFLDAVNNSRKPLADGYDGLQAVRVIQAASQSIKEKRVIKLGL